MAKPYDDGLKVLVRTNPQAFIAMVFPEAQYVRELPEKLKDLSLEMDALFEVIVKGVAILVHFEFQTHNDATMRERLLRYNVLTRITYEQPVHSCAIHLLGDGVLPASPLQWESIPGQLELQFFFRNIELSKLAPEDLLQFGYPALLPLLPLTKGSARREVVDSVFSGLIEANKKNLLPVGQSLASLAFGRNNTADQEWLVRRYKEMFDVLRETPIYQEMTRTAHEEGWEQGREKGLREGRQEGREKGLQEGLREGLREGRMEGLEKGLQEGLREGRQEGLEKGLQEGRQEALRQTLLNVVRLRFPKLERLARGQAIIIDEPAELDDLIAKLILAQNVKEARRALIGDDEDDE